MKEINSFCVYHPSALQIDTPGNWKNRTRMRTRKRTRMRAYGSVPYNYIFEFWFLPYPQTQTLITPNLMIWERILVWEKLCLWLFNISTGMQDANLRSMAWLHAIAEMEWVHSPITIATRTFKFIQNIPLYEVTKPSKYNTLDDEFHIGLKSGEKYTHLSKGWNWSQTEA